MDVITYALSKKYADKIATTFAGGLKYQGSKQTVADLPAASSSNKGHMYTVIENGHEYVSDGAQWVDLGADLANKADKTELQAEANLREAADEVLQTNIDTEETARTNADALLQGNIDSEVTTRTNADIALNNSITTEVNARETAINNVNESINQEAITREQADLTLQSNISAKQDIISDLATIRSGAALGATALQEHQDISGKVDKQVIGSNGKALIFNEADGGGAKFEHTDGTWSFAGVNDGGASSLAAQIYAVDSNNSYRGSKLDITKGGMYYTTGETSGLPVTQRDVADNELLVRKDIADKLDILPVVEDPEDPGYGYPYWIPYSFATTSKADGLDIILKTLTLDNTLRKMNFTNAFPVASSTQAGIMIADDKVKLDSIDMSTKQDVLTAGNNITLENNVISATDTKYTVTLDI